jgi:hypothetical protein
MTDVEHDPEALTNSAKLDQLLGLVATMNTRLDRQSQRLMMVEAAIPLLTQAYGVVLPTGSGDATGNTLSTGTDDGSDASGGGGVASAAGNVPNPDDELANGRGESVRTSGGGSGGTGARGNGVDMCGGCIGACVGGGFDACVGRGGYATGESEGHGSQSDLGGGRFSRNHPNDTGSYRPKINFPKYDGESDPLPWFNKCTTYFRGMGTPPAERVWIASLNLDGIAAEWNYALERDVGPIPWQRFSDFINMRFGPPLCHNRLAELKDLRHTSTIDAYQRQFLTLLCRCEDMTHYNRCKCFLQG